MILALSSSPSVDHALGVVLPLLRPATADLVRAVALPYDGTQVTAHLRYALESLPKRTSRRTLDLAMLGAALRTAAYLRTRPRGMRPSMYTAWEARRLAAVEAALTDPRLA